MCYPVRMGNFSADSTFVWRGTRVGLVRMTDGCIRTAIPLHRHGDGTFELHVILAGQGAVRTRGGEKSVRAGDFFITPGGLEHEQTSRADDPVRELCVYAVQTPPAGEKLLQDGMLWMGSAGEEMLFCARQAARELRTARTDGGEILSCYFRLMLLYAERSRGKGADCGAQVGGGSIFLRIDDAFLYDHASVTLPELANRVGLSERQLQRVLRERYGKTFLQKRTEARMRAANLLLAEGKTISEIAEKTGYSCPEHFCTEYKKYMGMTAREYRKRLLGTDLAHFER